MICGMQPHAAVIRVYDAGGDAVETHECAGDLSERASLLFRCVWQSRQGNLCLVRTHLRGSIQREAFRWQRKETAHHPMAI